MAISLRKLQIFVAVAKSGSVSRAAEQLLLSQSAVSMALADLEEQRSEYLFIRRGRKLLLNDRGRTLLPLAEKIVRESAEFEKILIDSATEPTGQIKIGASTTIGNYLLPLLIARFAKKYPAAKIAMQVGNSEEISGALDKGDIDLAVIEGPCHNRQLRQQFWREDKLLVVVGKDHPWTLKRAVTKADLQNAEWLMREPGSGTREVFEQALAATLTRLPQVVELGHTEAIKKAVEAGLGVSCLSQLAVERELESGSLMAVRTPLQLSRNLTLLLPDIPYQSPLLKACLSLLGVPSHSD